VSEARLSLRDGTTIVLAAARDTITLRGDRGWTLVLTRGEAWRLAELLDQLATRADY